MRSQDEIDQENSLFAWLEEQAQQDKPPSNLGGDIPLEEITMTLHYLMRELPAPNRRILKLRFGLEGTQRMSLEAIAEKLGVAKSEVNSIIVDSLATMRLKHELTTKWLAEAEKSVVPPGKLN